MSRVKRKVTVPVGNLANCPSPSLPAAQGNQGSAGRSFDGSRHSLRRGHQRSHPEPGVDVRFGLHTGEWEVRGDHLAGLTVHIAGRVAAIAGAGEVLVSSTVKDLVAGSGITFADRGEPDLKGVPDTWRLYAVQD